MLIDGRHGVKDLDRDMLKRLDQAALSYQIVLTKRDEVKMGQVEKTSPDARRSCANIPPPIPTSSSCRPHKGEGLADLRAAIARLVFRARQDDFRPGQIG